MTKKAIARVLFISSNYTWVHFRGVQLNLPFPQPLGSDANPVYTVSHFACKRSLTPNLVWVMQCFHTRRRHSHPIRFNP